MQEKIDFIQLQRIVGKMKKMQEIATDLQNFDVVFDTTLCNLEYDFREYGIRFQEM